VDATANDQWRAQVAGEVCGVGRAWAGTLEARLVRRWMLFGLGLSREEAGACSVDGQWLAWRVVAQVRAVGKGGTIIPSFYTKTM
jgi:hypothetical protein